MTTFHQERQSEQGAGRPAPCFIKTNARPCLSQQFCPLAVLLPLVTG